MIGQGLLLLAADGPPQRRTLLLVEDEPDLLRLMRDFLGLALPGWTVVAATSGAKALEQLAATVPAVMVTDYLMPGMNGLELARQVRQGGHVFPVVLVTAFADSGLEEQTKGIVQAFFRKPVDPALLVQRIQGLVQAAP